MSRLLAAVAALSLTAAAPAPDDPSKAIINGIVVLAVLGIWTQARKGAKWAFVLGMTLYAADSLIFLAGQDWLALAFHGFALWRMGSGFNAARALGIVVANAERKAATATASWSK